MAFSKALSFSSLILFTFVFITYTHGTNFEVVNNCPFTVWAAASPGGGGRLDRGQTSSFNVEPGSSLARIWPRTNCSFDGLGKGHCQTGDCDGLFQCQGNGGSPPNTLAEFALNQSNNLDFFDISVVDGFNVGMDLSPKSNKCKGIRCDGNINSHCPSELKAPGGCNNPCTVFKTDDYCCTSGSGSCGPTNFSRFFKNTCPDAYTYPNDNANSTFTCPAGTNYTVVFCPSYAANFEVINHCPFTVWAAAIPGGGARLEHGESWPIRITPRAGGVSRIWARTNCNFDSSGKGHCESGDCAGLLQCQDYGTAPNTLVEYSLSQDSNSEIFNISLVNGFNVGIGFSPKSNKCKGIKCSGDINAQCPTELRDPGGCNNPCTVFGNNQYCCDSGSCGPTVYSRFFKDLCPDAYTYPMDDTNSTFTCPVGTNYTVMFCP